MHSETYTSAHWRHTHTFTQRGAGANSAVLNDNDMATGLRHGLIAGREKEEEEEEECYTACVGGGGG